MNRSRISRLKRSALAAVIGFGAVIGLAPAAQAHQDGTKNINDFIFYYNSYWAGSYSDFAFSISNLAGYTFLTPGAGQGQAVKNNSASVENYRNQYARVYFNSGYAGINDLIPPYYGVQLTNTYNENASFQWV